MSFPLELHDPIIPELMGFPGWWLYLFAFTALLVATMFTNSINRRVAIFAMTPAPIGAGVGLNQVYLAQQQSSNHATYWWVVVAVFAAGVVVGLWMLRRNAQDFLEKAGITIAMSLMVLIALLPFAFDAHWESVVATICAIALSVLLSLKKSKRRFKDGLDTPVNVHDGDTPEGNS